MKRGRGRPRGSANASRESTPSSETKRKKVGRGRGGRAAPSDASNSREASAAPSPSSSRSSTPVSVSRSSTPSLTPAARRSTRAAAQKSKQLIQEVISAQKSLSVSATTTSTPKQPKKPVKKYKPADSSDESEPDEYYDESDVEEDEEESSSHSSASEAEAESDVSEESEASVESGASSTPGRKRVPPRTFRPPTPVWLEKEDVPTLDLPKSSNDLLIENKDLLDAIAVYEVLRHFHQQLRLSPCRFEDFCAALVSEEQCNMLAEIHISLMRALLREEDGNSTTFGPHDCRDSVNIQLFLLDGMTWPEVVRSYIECDKEYHEYLPYVEAENYPFLTVTDKVKVLLFLTDQFLASNKVREEILGEGAITYDDHCRNCHRLGDLLCCETCSAVYHLECVDPPLYEVPEDDWLCAVCLEHQVPGVVDCISEVEKSGMLIRHEPLGYDRHGRKYYHVSRRIVVESDDNDVRYYSSRRQFEELLHTLDPIHWERDLFQALLESKTEILAHMDKTEELTNSTRGNQKSALQRSNDELLAIIKEREEAEAEKRQKEEDEAKKKQDEEEARKAMEVGKTTGEEIKTDSQESNGDKKTANESSKADDGTNVEVDQSGEEITKNKEEDASKGSEPVGEATASVSSAPSTSENKMDTETKMDADKGDASIDHSSEDKTTDKVTNGEGESSNKECVKDDDAKADDMEKNADAMETKTEENKDEGESHGVMTRSRNPNYKPPPPKSSPFVNYSTSTPVRKAVDSDDSVLVINAKGEIKRVESRKAENQSLGLTNISINVGDSDFRLGMEGNYKLYKNQYSCSRLGLNKPQHAELRDKTRYLSHKFSLTQLSEFKWNGTVYGNKILTISTLRLSITQLETNITKPFMHTNWAVHRNNWIKAVHMCNKPHEFALALSILECAIKPVIFNPVWSETLGHTTLMRTTAMEREEKKKADRKRKDYDPYDDIYADRSTWVKCSFPLKHSIWKWKGEEYRITSGDGWMWISKTRRRRQLPAPSPAKLCVDASTKKAIEDGTNQIPDTPLPAKPDKKPKMRPRRGPPRSRGHVKHSGTDVGSVLYQQYPMSGEGDAPSAVQGVGEAADEKVSVETEDAKMDVEDASLGEIHELVDKKDEKKTEEKVDDKEEVMDTSESKSKESDDVKSSDNKVEDVKDNSSCKEGSVQISEKAMETSDVAMTDETDEKVLPQKETLLPSNKESSTDTKVVPKTEDGDQTKIESSDADKIVVSEDVSEDKSQTETVKKPKIDAPTTWDEIDISIALKTHTLYKKIPYRSKLEGFLDRRMKQQQAEQQEFQNQLKRYETYQKALKDKEQLEKLLAQAKSILSKKKTELSGVKLITSAQDKSSVAPLTSTKLVKNEEKPITSTLATGAVAATVAKQQQEVRKGLSPTKFHSSSLGLVNTTPVSPVAKVVGSGGLTKLPQVGGQSSIVQTVKPAIETIKAQGENQIQTVQSTVKLSPAVKGVEETSPVKPAKVVVQVSQASSSDVNQTSPSDVKSKEEALTSNQSAERAGIFAVLKSPTKPEAGAESVGETASTPAAVPSSDTTNPRIVSSRSTEFHKPTSTKVPTSFQAAYLSMLASVSSLPGIKAKSGESKDSKETPVKERVVSTQPKPDEAKTLPEMQGREAGNLIQEASGLSERGVSALVDTADHTTENLHEKSVTKLESAQDSDETTVSVPQEQTPKYSVDLPLLKEEIRTVSESMPVDEQSVCMKPFETESEKVVSKTLAMESSHVEDIKAETAMGTSTAADVKSSERGVDEKVLEQGTNGAKLDELTAGENNQGTSQSLVTTKGEKSATSDVTSDVSDVTVLSTGEESKKAIEISSAKVSGGFTTVTIRRTAGAGSLIDIARSKLVDTPSTSSQNADCNHQSAVTDDSKIDSAAKESNAASDAVPENANSNSCGTSHGCNPESPAVSQTHTTGTVITEASSVDTIAATSSSSSSSTSATSTSTPCGTSMGCGTPPQSPTRVGPCGTSLGCNTPPQSPTTTTTAQSTGEIETPQSTNCNHTQNNVISSGPEDASKTTTVTSSSECNHKDTTPETSTASNLLANVGSATTSAPCEAPAATSTSRTSASETERTLHCIEEKSQTISSSESVINISSSSVDDKNSVSRTDINSTKEAANSSVDDKLVATSSNPQLSESTKTEDRGNDGLSALLPPLAPITNRDAAKATSADAPSIAKSIAPIDLPSSNNASSTGASGKANSNITQSETIADDTKTEQETSTTSTTIVTTTVVTTTIAAQKVVTTTTTTTGGKGKALKVEKTISASEALTKMVHASKMAATTQGGKTTMVQFSQTALETQIKKLEEGVLLESVAYPKRKTSTTGGIYLACKYSKKKAIKKIAKPLPLCRKFATRSKQKSILVLPPQEIMKLGRRAGHYEVEGFNYNAKNVGNYWPYPAPRPTFRICWRYRVQKLKSFAERWSNAAHFVWACIRWDDLSIKPPHGSVNTTSTETEVIKTELVDKRDVMPSGLKSEYLMRKIITPIRTENEDREVHKPQRSGLRSSSQPTRPIEAEKLIGPRTEEVWIPEETLEMWEIVQFSEKKQKEQAIRDREAKEAAAKEAKQQARIKATNQSNEATTKAPQTSLKIQLEDQLKQQRAVGQQKRLSYQPLATTKVVTITQPVTTPTLAPITISAATIGRGRGQVIQTKPGIVTLTPQSLKAIPQIIRPQTTVVGASPGFTTFTPGIRQVTRFPAYTTAKATNSLAATIPSINTPGARTVIIRTPAGATIQQQRPQIQIAGTTVQAAAPGVVTGQPAVRIAGPAGQTAQTQLSGQAHVYTAQAQAVIVGGQKFVITPAQVQVQGTGQMIPAQLIQTTTSQGTTLQRLVLTPGGAAAQQGATIQGGTTGTSINLQATLQALQAQAQGQNQAATTPAATAGAKTTFAAATPAATVIPKPVISPTVVVKTGPLVSPSAPQVRMSSPPGVKRGVVQVTKPSPDLLSAQTLEQQLVLQMNALQQRIATELHILPPQQLEQLKQQLEQIKAQVNEQKRAARLLKARERRRQQTLLKQQQREAEKQKAEKEQQQLDQQHQQQQLQQITSMQGQDKQLQMQFQQQLQQQEVKIQAARDIETQRVKQRLMTPAEKQDSHRMFVCQQVMKSMLDKIEREEKISLKRKLREETQVEKRQRTMVNRLSTMLHRQKEALRREILSRREHMEQGLKREIQEEYRQKHKKDSKKRKHSEGHSTSISAPPVAPEVFVPDTSKQKKKKKSKMITTTPASVAAAAASNTTGNVEIMSVGKVGVVGTLPIMQSDGINQQLFCVCKTPYDESQFYIGCDMCQNWFHGSCVNITEEEAEQLNEYVCKECDLHKQQNDEELYCICRTPYDEAQFYIGCDRCNDWYHGHCVGITQTEAETIENYICPNCQSKSIKGTKEQKPLSTKDYEQLKKIVRQLESHKMAWPFLEPVSDIDAPDYYQVIKEPMDLSVVEEKVKKKDYNKLHEFMADVSKIFDNCRYYNPSDSPFYQCAGVLEKFFVQKVKETWKLL
ncbi:nucleosome-remodeling factor subunit BPTF-like isoform X2 [Amphiura filiformis]|uniref:nucleosome-remodeling factor subunit BPTF-like isoform X2 n=1 Tax=Amphiura filiformis TaxID=82378 RepID=UPI003B219CA2